jgi:hypothetical protein
MKLQLGQANRSRVFVFGDQLVSTASNMVIWIVASSSMTQSGFGEFAVMMTAAQLIVGTVRASIGEPLLIGSTPGAIGRGEIARSVSQAAGVALAAALLVVAVSTRMSEPVGMLMVFVVGVVAQDISRFIAIARSRADLALASDVMWLALIVGWKLATSHTSSRPLMNAWLVTGAIAGLPLLGALLYLTPHRQPPRAIPRSRRARCLVEYLTSATIGMGLVLIIAARGSSSDAGVLRAGLSITGVGAAIAFALQLVVFAEGRSVTGAEARSLVRKARQAGLASLFVTLVVVLIMLVPLRRVTEQLLGDSWLAAGPILWILGFVSGFGAGILTLLAAIRGSGGGKYSLRIAAVHAVLVVGGAFVLAPQRQPSQLATYLALINGAVFFGSYVTLTSIVARGINPLMSSSTVDPPPMSTNSIEKSEAVHFS